MLKLGLVECDARMPFPRKKNFRDIERIEAVAEKRLAVIGKGGRPFFANLANHGKDKLAIEMRSHAAFQLETLLLE